MIIDGDGSRVEIPCKYFNGGKGVCPFGESCFYSHRLANGETFVSRMVMQPDGELRDIGHVGMKECVNCSVTTLATARS